MDSSIRAKQRQNIADYWEGKAESDDPIVKLAKKAYTGAKGLMGMDDDEDEDSGDAMKSAISRRKMALKGDEG